MTIHTRMGRLAIAALAALGFAGCGGGGSGGGGGGSSSRLEITPNPIEFGQSAGAPVERDVVVQAKTGARRPVVVSDIAIEDDADGAFSLSGLPPFPATFNPGETFTFQARFDPSTAKAYEATLVITSDDTVGRRRIAMRGEGVTAGVIADPATVDFGAVDGQGGMQTSRLTIRNTDTTPRTITAVNLPNNAGGRFALSGLPSFPVTLQGGGSTSFNVTFTPNGDGSFSGELRILSDDPDRPDLRIALSAVVTGSGGGGGGASGEFQVNKQTVNVQSMPYVAALPNPASNGTVAVAVWFTFDDIGAGTEQGHGHHTFGGIGPDGRLGTVDSHVIHHTENVQYITIKADPVANQYSSPDRYHPSMPEPHAHSLFQHKISNGGGDSGALIALDTDRFPQGLTQLDIAVDPSSGRRMITFRVTGTSTAPGALPEPGVYGRILPRSGTTFVSAPFILSQTNDQTETQARVQWTGSNYLATWVEGGVVMGRYFDTNGSGGSEFAISEGTGASTPQLATYAGDTDALVVWVQGGTIRARLVTGPPPEMSAEVDLGSGSQPAPAGKTAGEWLVVMQRSGDVYGQKLSAALAPMGAAARINEVTDGTQAEPAATWVSSLSQWLVVWTGTDADRQGIKAIYVD